MVFLFLDFSAHFIHLHQNLSFQGKLNEIWKTLWNERQQPCFLRRLRMQPTCSHFSFRQAMTCKLLILWCPRYCQTDLKAWHRYLLWGPARLTAWGANPIFHFFITAANLYTGSLGHNLGSHYSPAPDGRNFGTAGSWSFWRPSGYRKCALWKKITCENGISNSIFCLIYHHREGSVISFNPTLIHSPRIQNGKTWTLPYFPLLPMALPYPVLLPPFEWGCQLPAWHKIGLLVPHFVCGVCPRLHRMLTAHYSAQFLLPWIMGVPTFYLTSSC